MAKSAKVKRIEKECARLLAIYCKIDANKLELLKPLIQNAAFMKVTLEELQAAINENGCSDEYQNGNNQYGTKASAELQAYNSLIKNYNTVCAGLQKYLPPEEKQESRLAMMLNE